MSDSDSVVVAVPSSLIECDVVKVATSVSVIDERPSVGDSENVSVSDNVSEFVSVSTGVKVTVSVSDVVSDCVRLSVMVKSSVGVCDTVSSSERLRERDVVLLGKPHAASASCGNTAKQRSATIVIIQVQQATVDGGREQRRRGIVNRAGRTKTCEVMMYKVVVVGCTRKEWRRKKTHD